MRSIFVNKKILIVGSTKRIALKATPLVNKASPHVRKAVDKANKLLHHRAARRVLIILAVLCTLILTAVGLTHSYIEAHRVKTPQERYVEENKHYPSVFKNFVSTLTQLSTPRNYNNSKVIDDPRFGPQQDNKTPRIYRPYPDYESLEWRSTHRGDFKPCVGPRGELLTDSLDDQVSVYVGDLGPGFPKPMFGSHSSIGVNGEVLYDRYSRYGAYGFGENETFVRNWAKPSKVDWDNVRWGDLQNKCVDKNAARFYDEEEAPNFPYNHSREHIPPERRTALLLRTYIGKKYSENDIYVIRSLITELSLQSGGEYSVVLLLHVKDESIPIDREDVYRETVEKNVPKEFWDITVLWNVPMVATRYPLLPKKITDVHHAQWLSVQNFAIDNPEFSYFWNWEMDSRYTGHHYEFVEKVAEFARNQPRRGMWERNARFYIPDMHGHYDYGFRNYVEQFDKEAVWGPVFIDDPNLKPKGPKPPVSEPEKDNYEWGVGEDADYISFLPIFHPIGTDWVIRNEVYGYMGVNTPRRASLITHSRVSRRLLLAMDSENVSGRHMSSELFPGSAALLHGLKAITAPHPIFSDKNFPPQSANKYFNSGVNGRAGSSKDSPFSWRRESRFLDLSWYYRANLAGRLYWNFLGWRKEGTGGKVYEFLYGRVVLPGILFHPIKDVRPDADSTHYSFDFQN
ncbi:hypothetical protein FQN50_006547 [Emmonsiellopsis sp. PD_5]|nr:hypothetical protein FQN50_006547 [Emmonsiellopsis sp. PD_5]